MAGSDDRRTVERYDLDMPFRATRQESPEADGSFQWQMEYDQTSTGRWGPRGVFTERDGRFFWAGREFLTVKEVLAYRCAHP